MIPRILLVEDNPADSELLGIAFEDAGRAVEIESVRDGRQARGRLQRLADGEALPQLIVLDINIPIVSGLELLALIRREPRLKEVPTVILTSSDRPQDHRIAQALNVSEYLIKPHELSGYEAIVAALGAHLDRQAQTSG